MREIRQEEILQKVEATPLIGSEVPAATIMELF